MEVDMPEFMEPVPVEDIGALCAQLRDLSGRYARFEEVPQAELDAFEARKLDVVGRIDPEAAR